VSTGPGAGRVLSGVAMGVGACASFAALDTTTKFLSASVPLLMALWFRYAFQAVATTLVVLPLRGASVWRTRRLPFHILRGVLLLASSFIAFTSLKYMPVGEFTAIVMIGPLVVTVLAATMLKEQVSALRWTLVAGGFAGTLILVRPGGETFAWAALLPLSLLVTNASFQLLTTRMARTEDPVTMHLYTGWVGALIASLALPYVWADLPDPWLWAGLCFMGLMGTIGHFMLILGFQRAPVSTLTPFLYSQIAFAMLGGWLVFGHLPDGWGLAGIALIAACGAAGAWLTVREQRSGAGA
jgi:drug/metabolite transporter (DMT)-like permease